MQAKQNIMELQATAAEEQLAAADQAQQALQDRLQAEKQVRQSTFHLRLCN